MKNEIEVIESLIEMMTQLITIVETNTNMIAAIEEQLLNFNERLTKLESIDYKD